MSDTGSDDQTLKQRIGTGYETDSTAGMTATQPSQPSQFSQLSQDTMGSRENRKQFYRRSHRFFI
jgi:hypothetical protein